ESDSEDFYVGFAPYKPEERLEKHNKGLVESTKRYIPWRLIFYEAYLDQQDALRREKYFKTSEGRRALKFMLKEYRDKHKQPDSNAKHTIRKSNFTAWLPEVSRVVKFDCDSI